MPTITLNCHEMSQLAGQTLRDMGFDTRVLFGGIEGGRDAGGDVVPVTQNAMVRS